MQADFVCICLQYLKSQEIQSQFKTLGEKIILDKTHLDNLKQQHRIHLTKKLGGRERAYIISVSLESDASNSIPGRQRALMCLTRVSMQMCQGSGCYLKAHLWECVNQTQHVTCFQIYRVGKEKKQDDFQPLALPQAQPQNCQGFKNE